MIDEEIKKMKEEAEANIQKLAAEKAEEIAKKYFDENKFASPEELEAQKTELKKDLADLQAKMKKLEQTKDKDKPVQKHFNEILAETIKENADVIQGFRPKSEPVNLVMKDADIMTIGDHTTNFTEFIRDVRPGLIMSPYNRIWLSDILPSATSVGNSIIYPVEDGGDGSVGLWGGGKTDKPQVDYKLKSATAHFKWLSGYVIVQREMLDDISWLTAYLQQKLLTSLKIAENDFILNGSTSSGGNEVEGILADATAYDDTPSYDTLLEKIIDAAYGQIVDETLGYYNPTTVVVNPRDAVKIGLNKAEGAGVFDLPLNTVSFQNGKLNVTGLETVSTADMDGGEFLAFDKNAMMLFRRMSPEIRMFEDAALAKQNQVMFRIEERITQAIFSTDAFVALKTE